MKTILLFLSILICGIFYSQTGYGCDGYNTYKTEDGGLNWEIVYDNEFVDLSFVNDTIGYGLYPGIWKTIDGGFSWFQVSTINFSIIDFVNELIGYASNSGATYKTIDGGYNWTEVYPQYRSNLSFICEDIGFGTYGNGSLFKTTDGGQSWTNINSNGYLGSISFVNEDVGFGSSGYDTYKTTDGGVTLEIVNTLAYSGLCFVSENVGYGTPGYDSFKTTDGGQSWELIHEQAFHTFSFPSGNTNCCSPSYATDIQSACDSYTWINGQTYTSDNNTDTDTLISVDGCDSIVTLDLTIHSSDFKVAFFTENQFYSEPPYSVIFTNQTPEFDSYDFEWDFGDGTVIQSNEINVSHEYVSNGVYTVTLTATDSATGCTDYHFEPYYIYISGFMGVNELSNSSKNLIKILDLMGRETSFKPNTPLIYVYDDGSIEKVFRVEY